MTEQSTTADLVVIGGGFAGLSASLRARELGLSVVLLEKGDENYLCNSRMSGGIIHICMLDIRRPPNELYEAIIKATADEVSHEQARALTENAARLVDWLQGHGARFMRFNMQEAYRWCMAPPRALVPGPDWVNRGPDRLLRELMAQLVAAGGRVRYRTKAKKLILESGTCRGVVAESEDGPLEVRAAAVLIADGGFQADRDSFTRYISANFDAVFQRGAASSFGDGLRMAIEAGARITGKRRFYGHLLSREARENGKLWPYPQLDAFATAGIMIGPDGRRFTNEGRGGVAAANALAQLPDPNGAVTIFDAAIWDGPGKADRIPANPLLEEAGATIYRADTIEDLARQVGIPAEALAATVAEYNAAIETGNGAALTPPREGAIKPFAIREKPFMAMRAMPGITYTMDGIEVDGSARVLNEDGGPIAGLFAAGSATGGLEGGGANAYIGGIVKAGVFGLLAAEEAARVSGRAETPTQTARPGERFPMLAMIVRHGAPAAAVIAPLVALLVAWLSWNALGLFGVLVGAVAGGAAYVAVRSYVEMVTLIVDMLMPK